MSKKVDPLAFDFMKLVPTRTPTEFYALEKAKAMHERPGGKVTKLPEANPMPPALMHDITMPEAQFLAFLMQTDPAFHEIALDRARVRDMAKRAWMRFLESRYAAKAAFEKSSGTHCDLARIRYHLFLERFLAMRAAWLAHANANAATADLGVRMGRFHAEARSHALGVQRRESTEATTQLALVGLHARVQTAITQDRLMRAYLDDTQTGPSLGTVAAMSQYQNQLTALATPVTGTPAPPDRNPPKLRVRGTR